MCLSQARTDKRNAHERLSFLQGSPWSCVLKTRWQRTQLVLVWKDFPPTFWRVIQSCWLGAHLLPLSFLVHSSLPILEKTGVGRAVCSLLSRHLLMQNISCPFWLPVRSNPRLLIDTPLSSWEYPVCCSCWVPLLLCCAPLRHSLLRRFLLNLLSFLVWSGISQAACTAIHIISFRHGLIGVHRWSTEWWAFSSISFLASSMVMHSSWILLMWTTNPANTSMAFISLSLGISGMRWTMRTILGASMATSVVWFSKSLSVESPVPFNSKIYFRIPGPKIQLTNWESLGILFNLFAVAGLTRPLQNADVSYASRATLPLSLLTPMMLSSWDQAKCRRTNFFVAPGTRIKAGLTTKFLIHFDTFFQLFFGLLSSLSCSHGSTRVAQRAEKRHNQGAMLSEAEDEGIL